MRPWVEGAAANWPGGKPTEIGGPLPLWFRPSGLAWHAGTRRLYVVDDRGRIADLAPGAQPTIWDVGGDLEGIAIPGDGSLAYVAIEHPDAIRELDLVAGAFTSRRWTLTTWMSGPEDRGLEALTWVPNGHHPYPDGRNGGLFYAGHEGDGKVYVFDVDRDRSEEVELVATLELVPGRAGLTGLHYEPGIGNLLALYGDENHLLAALPNGSFIGEWSMPGNDQEGVTMIAACPSTNATILIAEDEGPEVWRFPDLEVRCPKKHR